MRTSSVYRIEVPGRMPTLNWYRNAHFHELSKSKREWEEIIGISMLAAKIRAIQVPFTLSVTSFTVRERDCDNCVIASKYFQDTLRNMGIIPDDKASCIRPLILDWQKAKSEKDEKTVFIIQ